ncbi:MAG: glycosyltransferase family 1 protein [Rhodocyclaceae bacterium]|nr:glycosyltransferase family 1 protein [Rhodocyclaceae bacterium]
MRRLLIDVTSTVQTGFNTGIQRVVRNIAKLMPEIAERSGILVEHVVFDGVDFRIIELDHNIRCFSRKAAFWNKVERKARAIAPLLMAHADRSSKLRKLGIGPWRHYTRWQPAPTDILLMPDATWNYHPWTALREAREAGCKIHAVVYDLLPLKYPQFFDDGLVAAFRDWWEIMGYYTDAYHCISKSVKSDVVTRLPITAKNDVVIDDFPMGADFSQAGDRLAQTAAPPIPHIDWEKSTVFLMVGTLEPRKNHVFVLNAFDLIWRKSNNACLVIVGRRGWLSDSLWRRILAHPLLNKNLFILDHCNDKLLQQLYSNVDAVIAASIDEGYGLPIIEAEANGVAVLASDIPVFREVAGPNVAFFSLDSISALSEALLEFASREKSGPPFDSRGRELSSHTWRASVDKLYARLTEACVMSDD